MGWERTISLAYPAEIPVPAKRNGSNQMAMLLCSRLNWKPGAHTRVLLISSLSSADISLGNITFVYANPSTETAKYVQILTHIKDQEKVH